MSEDKSNEMYLYGKIVAVLDKHQVQTAKELTVENLPDVIDSVFTQLAVSRRENHLLGELLKTKL